MQSGLINRRQAIAPILLVAATPAFSQLLPSAKPIRIVVIVAPGGSADFTARLIAEKLQDRLKRTVIVENKPGAGGNLASALVARSAADGATLLLTSNNHNVNPLLFREPGYDPKTDFSPVSQIVRGPSVLVVNPEVPVKTLREYVEYSKAKPRSMFYATYGTGSAAHIAGELLKTASQADIEHVPYKGAGPALNEVLGGSVPSAILSLFSAANHIKAGKLRAIAIFSEHRWPGAPEIPTATESGYKDASYDIWLGLMAPKRTAPELVALLNREVRVVVSEPEVAERLKKQGMAPTGETAKQFESFLRNESATVAKLIAAAGITPQ
jgi:tripartite-type tricarboxylate transporter receptor subunit TctC